MRWGAGIVGGLLTGLLAYWVASLVAVAPQLWAFWVGWALAGAWYASSGPFAWARAWMTLSVLSLCLPLVTIVFTGRLGAQLTGLARDPYEAAGAAMGGRWPLRATTTPCRPRTTGISQPSPAARNRCSRR